MKRILFLLLVFAISFSSVLVVAQEVQGINVDVKQIHDRDISKLSVMERMEDTLVYLADSMHNSTFPDNKTQACYAFIKTLKNTFNESNAFSYPFKKLKNSIGILYAPDNSFRIFNWEVIKSDVERRYYGVIQLKDGKIIPLVDVSDQIIRGAEDSIFMNNRWYGALYYNVLQRNVGGSNVYFFLGWNGTALNSERKIVEPFGFNTNGQGVFGAPLFNVIDRGKRVMPNRYIYEYQKGAKISLNYDKETDQIIYDHCESQIGDPNKKFTYIPDGSYDALKWDGSLWSLFFDVIQVMPLEQGNAPIIKPIK